MEKRSRLAGSLFFVRSGYPGGLRQAQRWNIPSATAAGQGTGAAGHMTRRSFPTPAGVYTQPAENKEKIPGQNFYRV